MKFKVGDRVKLRTSRQKGVISDLGKGYYRVSFQDWAAVYAEEELELVPELEQKSRLALEVTDTEFIAVSTLGPYVELSINDDERLNLYPEQARHVAMMLLAVAERLEGGVMHIQDVYGRTLKITHQHSLSGLRVYLESGEFDFDFGFDPPRMGNLIRALRVALATPGAEPAYIEDCDGDLLVIACWDGRVYLGREGEKDSDFAFNPQQAQDLILALEMAL